MFQKTEKVSNGTKKPSSVPKTVKKESSDSESDSSDDEVIHEHAL